MFAELSPTPLEVKSPATHLQAPVPTSSIHMDQSQKLPFSSSDVGSMWQMTPSPSPAEEAMMSQPLSSHLKHSFNNLSRSDSFRIQKWTLHFNRANKTCKGCGSLKEEGVFKGEGPLVDRVKGFLRERCAPEKTGRGGSVWFGWH
jgi:hypothetical protein